MTERSAEWLAGYEVGYREGEESVRADVAAREEAEDLELALEVHRVEVARLRALVEEAIELAEEGWAYSSDYFREKWRCDDRLDDLRKRSTSARPKEP